jgi:hypothetical protein
MAGGGAYNPATMTRSRAILYGGLTVGTLDFLDAWIFFGIRNGSTPVSIGHSIAAGLLGSAASRAGGVPTAALGVGLHYFIAFGIVTVYVVASQFIPALKKKPVVFGILYGVAAYFFMNWVVIPLSAIGGTPRLVMNPVFFNGILIHMFGVGLPSALFAARARGR